MANFDAIRTAHIGALEYICRPKEKPAALLGCWTLGDESTTDLSRYGGSVNFNYTPTFTDTYGFPFATTTSYGMNTFTLGTALNLGVDWSMEGYFKDPVGRSMSQFQFIDVIIGCSNDQESSNVKILKNNTTLTAAGSWRNGGGTLHRAVQYTAADTTIRAYKNGAVQASATIDLSGLTTSIVAFYFGSNAFSGNGDQVRGIANFRVVQKALGTSSTFPTPSGLFTGYEAL